MRTHLLEIKHLWSHFNYQTLTASHVQTNNADVGGTKGCVFGGLRQFWSLFHFARRAALQPATFLGSQHPACRCVFFLSSLSRSFASEWFGSPLRWHSLPNTSTQSPIAHCIINHHTTSDMPTQPSAAKWHCQTHKQEEVLFFQSNIAL